MRKITLAQRSSALTMAFVLALTNMNLDAYGPVYAEEVGDLLLPDEQGVDQEISDSDPVDDQPGETTVPEESNGGIREDVIPDAEPSDSDSTDSFSEDGLIIDPDADVEEDEAFPDSKPEIASIYMKAVTSSAGETKDNTVSKYTLDLSTWNTADLDHIDITYEVHFVDAEDAFSDWDMESWEEILLPVLSFSGVQRNLFLEHEADTRVEFDETASTITIRDLTVNPDLLTEESSWISFRFDTLEEVEQTIVLPGKEKKVETEVTAESEVVSETEASREMETEELSEEVLEAVTEAPTEAITEEELEAVTEAEAGGALRRVFTEETDALPEADTPATRSYIVNQTTYNMVEKDTAVEYQVKVIAGEDETVADVAFSGVKAESFDEASGTYTITVDAKNASFGIATTADVEVTPINAEDAGLIVSPPETKVLNGETMGLDFQWRKTFTYTVNQTLKNIDDDYFIYKISTKVSNNAGKAGTEPLLQYSDGVYLFNRDNPESKDGRTTFGYCIKVPKTAESFQITTTAGDIKIEPITVQVIGVPTDPMAGETLETGDQIYVANHEDANLTGSSDGIAASFVISKIQNYTVHQTSDLEEGTIKYQATVTVPKELADQEVDGSKIDITTGDTTEGLRKTWISKTNENGSTSYIYKFEVPAGEMDIKIRTTATKVEVTPLVAESDTNGENVQAYPSFVTVTKEENDDQKVIDIKKNVTYTVDQTSFNIDGENTYEVQIVADSLNGTKPIVTVADAESVTEAKGEDDSYIYTFQIPVTDTEFEIVTAAPEIKVIPAVPEDGTVEKVTDATSSEEDAADTVAVLNSATTSASYVLQGASKPVNLNKRWYDYGVEEGEENPRENFEFGLKYKIGDSEWTDVPVATAEDNSPEADTSVQERAAIRDELHLTEDLTLTEEEPEDYINHYSVNGPVSKNGQKISYQLTERWIGDEENPNPYVTVEYEDGSLANYNESDGYTVKQTSYNLAAGTENKYIVTIPRSEFGDEIEASLPVVIDGNATNVTYDEYARDTENYVFHISVPVEASSFTFTAPVFKTGADLVKVQLQTNKASGVQIRNGDGDFESGTVEATWISEEDNQFVTVFTIKKDLTTKLAKTLFKNWYDGSDAAQKARFADGKVNVAFTISYRLEDGEWIDITEDNAETVKTDLCLDQMPEPPTVKNEAMPDGYSGPVVYDENSSLKVYDFTLATYEANGEVSEYLPTSINGREIEYKLKETLSGEAATKYHTVENTDGSISNYLIKAYSATVQWSDANNAYLTRDEDQEWFKYWVENLKLEKTSASGTTKVELTTEDPDAEGYITFEVDEETGNWIIRMPNTYGYDEQNFPYSYALFQENPDPSREGLPVATGGTGVDEDSTYIPKYENAGSYSSIEEGLYDGGTLIDTLSGNTIFTFSKTWKDEFTSDKVLENNRPATTVTLYRYPLNSDSASYQTASPVPNTDPEMVVRTDIGAGIEHEYTFEEDLPEYDPNGYRYIYFVKEKMSGGDNYVTKVSDADKEKREEENIAKRDTIPNTMIFNGEHASNVRTDTTSVGFTKTFKANARIDYPAKVEFSVSRTNSDGVTSNVQVKGQNGEMVDAVASMDGFNSENTTQEAKFNGLAKYDEEGLPYTYKANEIQFYTKNVDDEWVKATRVVEDGNIYFITADGYRYLSERDGEDITNTLVGEAEIIIDKSFPNGMIEGRPTNLGFTVYRNGVALATTTQQYAYDENAAENKPENRNLIGYYKDGNRNVAVTADEAAGKDVITFERYDESGREYEYIIKETDNDGYGWTEESVQTEEAKRTNSSDTAEKYLQVKGTFSNHLGDGYGGYITVYKTWKDDGEDQYRLPVNVALQYRASAEADWETIGSGQILDEKKFVKITLTHEDSDDKDHHGDKDYVYKYAQWKEAVKNGTSTADSGEFRVVETSLGNGQDGYQVIPESADGTIEGHPEHRTGYDFVSTGNQNYDVQKQADHSVTIGNIWYDFAITNIRVGTETITVRKEWIDGKDQTEIRPDEIKITVTADRTIWTEDPADSATAGYDPNTNALTATDNVKTYTLNADSRSDTEPESRIAGNIADPNFTINDYQSEVWAFKTEPLMKYDLEGKIIEYTVSEETEVVNPIDGSKVKLSDLGYSSSMEHYTYDVGENHTGDKDYYKITNKLEGQVTPYMNKYWADTDLAAQRRKRPDIYSTLYRSYKDSNNVVHYEKYEYRDHDWITTRMASNWWQVSYAPVERYNSEGYEYTYYIAETIATQDTEYVESGAYTGEEPVNETGDSKASATFSEYVTEKDGTVTQKTVRMIPNISAVSGTYTEEEATADPIMVAEFTPVRVGEAESDTNRAIGGTIVNKPQKTRTVTGKKIWTGLPKNFKQEDLPELRLRLWRVRYDDVETWKDGRTGTYPLTWKASEAVKFYLRTQQSTSDDTVEVLENETNEGVEEAVLPAGTVFFEFMNNDGSKLADFPKYDETGKPYYYIITENTFVNEDGKTENLDLQQLFLLTQDTTNGIVATNSYISDQNYEVDFTKTWENIPANLTPDQYPTITLELVRTTTDVKDITALNKDRSLETEFAITDPIFQQNGTEEEIGNHLTVVANGDYKNKVTLTFSPGTETGTNGTLTCEQLVNWSDLAHYAPNGRIYRYYVREYDADGVLRGFTPYKKTAEDAYELLENDEDTYAADTWKMDEQYTIQTKSEDFDYQGTSNIEIKNHYPAATGAVKVQKDWEVESQYNFGLIPDSITTVMYRTSKANDGTTQITEVLNKDGIFVPAEKQEDGTWKSTTGESKATIDPFDVIIDKHVDADQRNAAIGSNYKLSKYESEDWTTIVHNLELYAPNGAEYSYNFAEKVDSSIGQLYDVVNPNGVHAEVIKTSTEEEEDKISVDEESTYVLINKLKTVGASFTKKLYKKDISSDATSSEPTEMTAEDVLFNTSKDGATNGFDELKNMNAIPKVITVRYRYSLGEINPKGDGTFTYTWSEDWKDVDKKTAGDGTSTAAYETVMKLVTSGSGSNAAYEYQTEDGQTVASVTDLPEYVFETVTTGDVNRLVARKVRYQAYEYSATFEGATTAEEDDVVQEFNKPTLAESTDDAEIYTANIKQAGDTQPTETSEDAIVSNITYRYTQAADAEEDRKVSSSDTINIIPMKKITVRKVWDDDQNRDGKRTDLNIAITRVGVNKADDTDTVFLYMTQEDALIYKPENQEALAADKTWIPSNEEKKGVGDNSDIRANSIWEKSVYVPVYTNYEIGEKSGYSVTEVFTENNKPITDISYVNQASTSTTYVDQVEYTAAVKITDYGADVALEQDGDHAYFKNILPKKDSFTIVPNKNWTYTDANGQTFTSDEILNSENNNILKDGITFPLTVPEGSVFVLADDRNSPEDSRIYGPVSIDATHGRVITLIRRRGL